MLLSKAAETFRNTQQRIVSLTVMWRLGIDISIILGRLAYTHKYFAVGSKWLAAGSEPAWVVNQLAPDMSCCTVEPNGGLFSLSWWLGGALVVLGAAVRWVLWLICGRGCCFSGLSESSGKVAVHKTEVLPANSGYQTSGAEVAQHFVCGCSFLHSDKTLSMQRPCYLHSRWVFEHVGPVGR